MHGSAIAGLDMGAASIKMNDDGSFNLLVGATDIGTGSDTVYADRRRNAGLPARTSFPIHRTPTSRRSTQERMLPAPRTSPAAR
jgi:hypothetical protein